jgi:hypothetical protein
VTSALKSISSAFGQTGDEAKPPPPEPAPAPVPADTAATAGAPTIPDHGGPAALNGRAALNGQSEAADGDTGPIPPPLP